MTRTTLQFSSIAAGFMLLQACSTVPTANQKQVWAQAGKSVAIVVEPLPNTSAYKAGNQGLLDLAINSAVSGKLDSAVKAFKPNGFDTLASEFEKNLIARGLKAAIVQEDIEALPKFTKPADQPRGVQSFKQKIAASTTLSAHDYVLFVDTQQVGTIRSYYSVVPTSPPSGHYVGKGYLIDTRTNEIKWTQTITTNQAAVGKWDVPPNYTAVMQAIQGAVNQAKAVYQADLFQ